MAGSMCAPAMAAWIQQDVGEARGVPQGLWPRPYLTLDVTSNILPPLTNLDPMRLAQPTRISESIGENNGNLRSYDAKLIPECGSTTTCGYGLLARRCTRPEGTEQDPGWY